ncbi:MAG: caspase family protein [Sandaracinaceae bacterium]|nr:caspase family protein [Sandaracinaceae bacterium]
MRLTRGITRAALALFLLTAACDDDEEESTEGNEATEPTPPAATGPLLEQQGNLAADAPSDGRGRYDRYFVDVRANDRILVTLTSTAFDPILEVTPPSSGALVNDDWQGDTTRSQIELITSVAGQMKIEVRSYAPTGAGAYSLTARRVGEDGEAASVPVLSAGQTVDQAITGDGDAYVIRAEGPIRIAVSARGGAAPSTSVVSPDGRGLSPRDGAYEASEAGNYRLQVAGATGLAYRVAVTQGTATRPLLARAHHQFEQILNQLAGTAPSNAGDDTPPPPGQATDAAPTAPRALLVRIGDRLNGNLAANDSRLQSGEYYDVYELSVAQPGETIAIEMESATLDCFLRVDGPNGGHWENDDFGGTLNSRVELPLTVAGTYRIVTTSYREGETGPYELKVLTQRDAAASAVAGGAPAGGAPAGPEQRIEGELAQGDSTLRSGEFYDEHTFDWPAGARMHIEAQSTEFDTYLIVHPPSGRQQDNDDMVPGQSLNAGLDLQTEEAGTYRVMVTSYQPGETGHYTLVLGGGGGVAAPPPTGNPQANTPPAGGRTETGSLAQGDRTLQSGEFSDTFTMTFTPRSAVSIRLESSDFDTYLIVRSPSGNQEDNDDLTPGQGLNSGLDIPVAEPGEYAIVVTSYRPGETGRYTLRVSEGPSVVSPPSSPTPPNGAPPNGAPPNGAPPAAASGEAGRVWGLFAGITDYPGQTNDLPECANDARKLAEAVRNQGNMPSSQEFLLTDSQATTGNIRQAMQTIASRIRPDDVFIFFYSGHGGQTDSSSDPREIDERDEYMFVYDGRLMDDEVGQLFDQIHSRVSLIALDACFAGGFAKDVITTRGRVGLFSSEEDVTSAVASNFQAGGYLSHFLRLGIQGEADNDPNNAILTVGELTHYTWRQFGQHASDVRMSMGYQHLVVDRGAVPTSEVLWAVRR